MKDNTLCKGLSNKQVLELRNKFGENAIPFKDKITWFSIFISQLKSPLIYILIIVGLISFVLKEYFDAGLIAFVVIVNVLMGFFQEHSSQKTLTALRKILKPKAMVIREGERKEIESRELVPGDLAVLGSGDRIPADGKLVEGVNLLVNEAILTGEEEGVIKAEREGKERLFMGTMVISGRGLMRVEKIGLETEMGKMGKSLSEIEREETPLQKKLKIFAKNLTILILFVCLLIFLIGVLHKENPLIMLKMAVILSISAIPEGLPIAITIILALGMRKILKRQGLVKNLFSIETLGSTSVICTDKTGTLTEGKMKVTETNFLNRDMALLALASNNEQRTNLEVAVWDYVKKERKADFQDFFSAINRVYEEPFDSEKKYSMTVSESQRGKTAFLTGAPEIVLACCRVSERDRNKISEEIEKFGNRGLRILGTAFKENGNLMEKSDFSWAGLVGIADPLRKEAKEAISTAQNAGIKVKIVTGDYRKTAERVAASLGFKLEPKNFLEGKELENISEDELKRRIDEIKVFSRVTPHQKQKIVRALQEKGEIVAMTGDGVNDAQALKSANIGVVVNSASDVAKEAGNLILLDNNFKTIVAACEEGRLIFSNIKKTVGYVLSNSFAEITLILGAVLLDIPFPLTVAQILWSHIICDGPPDLVLAFEPKENSLMRERPEDIRREEIMSGFIKFLIFAISLSTGILSLFLFWYFGVKQGDLNFGRTIAFAVIASDNLIYIFAYKNLKKPIARAENFFQNKHMFWGVAYGFFFLFLAIYLPFLNRVLGTVPLQAWHWLLIFGVGLFATLLIELAKLLKPLIKITNGDNLLKC